MKLNPKAPHLKLAKTSLTPPADGEPTIEGFVAWMRLCGDEAHRAAENVVHGLDRLSDPNTLLALSDRAAIEQAIRAWRASERARRMRERSIRKLGQFNADTKAAA